MRGVYYGDEGGESLTTVYIDLWAAVNFVLNYLLLSAAGRLDGGVLRRSRWALAALVGAGYAVLSVLFVGFQHPIWKAVSGALLLLTAYGGTGRILRAGALFLLLSCGLSGGLTLLGETPGLRETLAAAALCYGGLSLCLGGEFRHSRGEVVSLTLLRGGKSVRVQALIDTGNTLRDPLTGYGVIVAEGKRMLPLLPELPNLTREEMRDPVATVARTPGCSLRLLPYRAVGVERGLLLAFRADRAVWDGQERREVLVALSPTPLTDGGGYEALIGKEIP